MNKKNKDRILVTGCAGFIGMHLCKSLLDDGYNVLGIDNLNKYYDPILKKDRLKILENYDLFSFLKVDITDLNELSDTFRDFNPFKVVNLAAQAGVQFSIVDPFST